MSHVSSVSYARAKLNVTNTEEAYNPKTTAALYETFDEQMTEIMTGMKEIEQNLTVIASKMEKVTPTMVKALGVVELIVSSRRDQQHRSNTMETASVDDPNR